MKVEREAVPRAGTENQNLLPKQQLSLITLISSTLGERNDNHSFRLSDLAFNAFKVPVADG